MIPNQASTEGTVDLVDVLDHVVSEFDVDRIARTDEIDGIPSRLVGGTFEAWRSALHAVIGDAVLISAPDQPVWLHLVATRRELTLWMRDDGLSLPESDLEALVAGPAFEALATAVTAAGGTFHAESAGAWRGCTVRVVLPIVRRARGEARASA